MKLRALAFLLLLVSPLPAAPARSAIAEPGDVIASIYGEVVRIDPKTLERTALGGIAVAGRLAIDSNGDLLMVNGSRIQRIDFETGELSVLYEGYITSSTVSGVVVAPDGLIYFVTSSGMLVRVDPVSGDAAVLLSGIECQVACGHSDLTGIALTPSGEFFLSLNGYYSGDPGYIVKADLGAGTLQTIASGDFVADAYDLVADVDGSLLVANARNIVRIDPATGDHSVVAEGDKLLAAYTIALSDHGRIYVSELGSAGFIVGGSQIVEIDPASGLQRILARPVYAGNVVVVPGIPAPPACRDGADNDGDHRRDFPFDRGCSSPDDGTEQPPCADGLDNDQDGLVDFPDDPGCADAGPLSQEAPQCSDLRDNDGDGWYDYPEDPGCLAPSDNTEHWIPPDVRYTGHGHREPRPACGLMGLELLLPLAALRARRRRRD